MRVKRTLRVATRSFWRSITSNLVDNLSVRGAGSVRREGELSLVVPRHRGLSSVTAIAGRQTGKVLSHVGNSRSAVYTIELADGTILTNMTPRMRGKAAGPEFDIRPAPNQTPCEYSIEDVGGQPTVVLHECEEEIDSEACAALPGSGVPGSGVTATEQANTPLRAPTKLVVAWTFNVRTVLPLTRHGLLLYSFPLGAIDIQSVVADLIISSSNVTNQIDVGMGTVTADGTNGTGLSGTQQDVVPVTNPGAISPAGLDYERLFPTTGESRPVLFDGTATAKSLFLNIARTSAGWDATGSIAVTGTIWIRWGSAGEIA